MQFDSPSVQSLRFGLNLRSGRVNFNAFTTAGINFHAWCIDLHTVAGLHIHARSRYVNARSRLLYVRGLLTTTNQCNDSNQQYC